MPHHDDRLAAEIGGDEIARIGHLAGVADEQPGAAEDALHFQVEQIRIGIDAPVHAAGLDELSDLVGVAVAHGLLSILLVVPAKAGTHNHRTEELSRRAVILPDRRLWVPAFAGTTG